MAKGKVPYRDFYIFTTPLHAVTSYFALKIGLGTIYYTRLIGVAERIMTGICLLYFASRNNTLTNTALVITGTIFAYSCDAADLLYYYFSESILFIAIAIIMFDIALRKTESGLVWFFAAGLMLGMASLERMHVGLLSSFLGIGGMVYYIVTGQFTDWRRGIKSISAVTLGIVLPMIICIGVLGACGALPQFIDQVFITGPTAKGPITTSFLRILTFAISHHIVLLASAGVAGGVLVVFAQRWWQGIHETTWKLYGFSVTGITIAILAAASVLLLLLRFRNLDWLPSGFHYEPRSFNNLRYLVIYFSFSGIVVFSATVLVDCIRRRLSTGTLSIGISALIALGAAYGNSLSWGAHETMLVPLLPVLAIALTRPSDRSQSRWTPSVVLFSIIGALLIVSSVSAKLTRPFWFSGWDQEFIIHADTESKNPKLAGMYATKQTMNFIDKLVEAVKANSSDRDRILVYPRMPLLYLLSERQAATFAPIQHMDVASDSVMRRDLETVKANPPVVIVRQVDDPRYLDDFESEFRNGKRSGQRDFDEMLNGLLSGYRKAFEGKPTSSSSTIEVWVRAGQALGKNEASRGEETGLNAAGAMGGSGVSTPQ